MTANSSSVVIGVGQLLIEHWPSLLVAAVALRLLSNWFQHGLHRIPGPIGRSISVIPRMWSVYQGYSHDDDAALHDRYGKIVRVAPNLLSVNDPNELNTIYGIGTKFYKSKFYLLVETDDGEGKVPDPFVTIDRERHTRLKRGAANAYSLNTMVQLEPYVNRITDRLVNRLHAFAKSGEAFDFSPELQNYAMDAVTSLTYGRDLNYMEAGDSIGLFKTTKLVNDYMAIFGQIPWCHRFLMENPWISNLLIADGSQKVVDIATDAMKKDREGLSYDIDGPVTFLQRLLKSQDSNPASINDREVMSHCFGNLFAGSDTTATALRSIIYHTLKSPRVHQRLTEELRSTLNISSGHVSFADVSKLPYLGAVIKEAIRLHPSVGMALVRVVPEGGATICDKFLRPGTEVGINPWLIHRDPDVYESPHEFYPERWMSENTNADRLKVMNRCWIPFGHGAHTCSGRWISWMEMHKMVATLFLLFDVELSDNGAGYHFKNLWFTQQTGLNLRVKKVTKDEKSEVAA